MVLANAIICQQIILKAGELFQKPHQRLTSDSNLHLIFVQAGLDSLGAVDLRNAISAKYAINLPATVAFDYPTITDLAEFLAPLLAPARQAERIHRDPEAVARDLELTHSTDIISTACILPGSNTGAIISYSLACISC